MMKGRKNVSYTFQSLPAGVRITFTRNRLTVEQDQTFIICS